MLKVKRKTMVNRKSTVRAKGFIATIGPYRVSMCQLPLQSEVGRRRGVLTLGKTTYDFFITYFFYCCKQFRRSKMKREGSLSMLLHYTHFAQRLMKTPKF